MFVLTNVSIMVAYGRLTWLPSPWDEVRNVGEKPTKFLLKVSISAGKRVEGFWVFSFYAENCGEMSGSAKRGTNETMEQWYQKKIHMFCNNRSNSIYRVFWEKLFLLITLPRFNVPDDLSHHGQGTTSLQYIDTRWLFRGWRDHTGHDVGLIPWCIPS